METNTDTDIPRLVAHFNDSSFWTIARPGRWVGADGHSIETQYVRGEGTVTLYKGRDKIWTKRGRSIADEVLQLVH